MENNQKHAYLIMAHNQFDLLKILISDIDDERNDIFLHIDSKSVCDRKTFSKWVKRSKLFLINPISIDWGGFSQIECIIKLLEQATFLNYYSYYHFCVGVEFPLKSQDYIHKFFHNHNGYEFIGFDNDINHPYEHRVRYYHVFNGADRQKGYIGRLKHICRIAFVKIQTAVKYDRLRNDPNILKKGNACWSITDSLARYIVSKKEYIFNTYRHSFCGDEVFIHTLVYNSEFWEKVYNQEDEYASCMRLTQWNRDNNIYTFEDCDILLYTDRLFARKFEGDEGISIVKYIQEHRK